MNEISKIYISAKCDENWSNMDTIGDAKFCSNCNKNVINFENSSHRDVIARLNNSNERVCGRFDINQLELLNTHLMRGNELSQNKLSNFILGILLFSSGCATTTNGALNHDHFVKAEYNVVRLLESENNVNLYKLAGRIVDEEGEPIPFVNVFVNGIENESDIMGTMADEKGNYSFEMDDRVRYDSIVNVTYLGYQESYMKLDEVANKEIVVTLKDSNTILGEICIERKRKRKRGKK